ncbi:MAG TPA: hypothetical protein VNJ08_12210 [Bacteriovoracaceae bacterium]|nr:hypothetical protein [Bacteriovoracaceae bacterium]
MFTSKYMFLMVLALTACGKNDKSSSSIPGNEKPKDALIESSENTLKVTKNRKVALNKDFSNSEKFKENINRYVLTFEADKGNFSNADVVCKKRLFGSQDLETHFDAAGKSASINILIAQTDPSILHIDCEVREWGVVQAATSVEIRKSVVIEGTKEIFSAIGTAPLETLYLEKDSVLLITDQNMKIKLNELISNSGKIMTYLPENVPASGLNKEGQDGGTLAIHTHKAWGKLFAELRGANGGETSAPDRKNSVAAQGASGPCDKNKYEDRPSPKCHGKDGSVGEVGSPGNKGMRGGNTGSLSLLVESEEEIEVDLQYFPGQGGPGSVGGIGGFGGPGGHGSCASTHNRAGDGPRHTPKRMLGDYACYPGGNKGPDGSQGNIGPAGSTGSALTSSFKFQTGTKESSVIVSYETSANWDNKKESK